MNDASTPQKITLEKLNQETSRIPWSELQRFFAGGLAINVAPELDLVDVALNFAEDDAEHIQTLLQSHKISKVSDQQAQLWFDAQASVWAVVVKPWVLVQLKK